MRPPVIIPITLVVLAAGAGAWFFLRPPATAPAVETRVIPPVTTRRGPPAKPESREAAPAASRRVTPKPSAAPAAPVEAAPTTATLRIETDVPDASVYIDRIGVGASPITVPNLAPGSHRLNVSAPGYDQHAETLELEPGTRTITVAFKEIRLDATIDVVHKHGMGSCEGQLSASPQGLRYNAIDGKDNFSVTLEDLETFEMDYLAKSLHVKARQGKTFNFTDRDGNVDRLFFFHSSVDKARKRVLASR